MQCHRAKCGTAPKGLSPACFKRYLQHSATTPRPAQPSSAQQHHRTVQTRTTCSFIPCYFEHSPSELPARRNCCSSCGDCCSSCGGPANLRELSEGRPLMPPLCLDLPCDLGETVTWTSTPGMRGTCMQSPAAKHWAVINSKIACMSWTSHANLNARLCPAMGLSVPTPDM